MGTAASFRPLVASDGAAFRRLLFALDDATSYMLFEPGERRDDGDEGFGGLELTVETVNEPAVALYRKAGFTAEGTLRSTLMIDGQPHDEYAMAKLLL